jgi:hypothetical protein
MGAGRVLQSLVRVASVAYHPQSAKSEELL